MKIQADNEGKKAIQSLCGVVVESIGGRVLPLVNTVLTQLKDIPPQEAEKVDVPQEEKAPAEDG